MMSPIQDTDDILKSLDSFKNFIIACDDNTKRNFFEQNAAAITELIRSQLRRNNPVVAFEEVKTCITDITKATSPETCKSIQFSIPIIGPMFSKNPKDIIPLLINLRFGNMGSFFEFISKEDADSKQFQQWLKSNYPEKDVINILADLTDSVYDMFIVCKSSAFQLDYNNTKKYLDCLGNEKIISIFKNDYKPEAPDNFFLHLGGLLGCLKYNDFKRSIFLSFQHASLCIVTSEHYVSAAKHFEGTDGYALQFYCDAVRQIAVELSELGVEQKLITELNSFIDTAREQIRGKSVGSARVSLHSTTFSNDVNQLINDSMKAIQNAKLSKVSLILDRLVTILNAIKSFCSYTPGLYSAKNPARQTKKETRASRLQSIKDKVDKFPPKP